MLAYREPRVTAVMVTGKSPERRPLAINAIRQFERQTYQNKELLIVNTGEKICPPRRSVKEIKLTQGELTLGDLRNIALEHAKGDWIMQWDDDDYHAPGRMAYQVRNRVGRRAQLLTHQVRLDLSTGHAFCHYEPVGIAGTILHPRSGARYLSLAKSEDSHFLKHFDIDRNQNYTSQAIYVRMYHGKNTWDRGHIIDRPASVAARDITPDAKVLAKMVYLRYRWLVQCFD